MKKSSRRPFIAGNWKMHKTVAEALALVRELRGQLEGGDKVEVAVAPPFTALHAVAQELAGSRIEVAAQNIHFEPLGAFTGEVSAQMVREAGARFVILGHSERRQFFGETDQTVNRRLRVALAAGLHPIVCVGETLQEREAGQTMEVVSRQLHGALANVSAKEAAGLVLAYEPVWAIGTGRTATAHQAQEVHAALRGLLIELVGGELAQDTRILYGGSVKADNAAELLAQADVDGALVGGASLKAADFTAIIRAAS